jgi:hypothetical protein
VTLYNPCTYHELEDPQVAIKEATEQTERAIGSRKRADSERDEYVQKFMGGCRQMERLHDRPHERSMSPVKYSHHYHDRRSSAYERVFDSSRDQLTSGGRA